MAHLADRVVAGGRYKDAAVKLVRVDLVPTPVEIDDLPVKRPAVKAEPGEYDVRRMTIQRAAVSTSIRDVYVSLAVAVLGNGCMRSKRMHTDR